VTVPSAVVSRRGRDSREMGGKVGGGLGIPSVCGSVSFIWRSGMGERDGGCVLPGRWIEREKGARQAVLLHCIVVMAAY